MAELLSIWEAALHDYRGSVDVENLTGLLDFLKCFHVHLSADGVEMRAPAVFPRVERERTSGDMADTSRLCSIVFIGGGLMRNFGTFRSSLSA